MPHGTAIDAFSLTFAAIPWWLTLILAAASASGAVWFYRDTVPPVSGPFRAGLTTIRALALFLVLVGIAEPVLRITATVPRSSVTAVLFDTSSSMNAASDPGRGDQSREVLDTLRDRLPGMVSHFSFDTTMHPPGGGPPAFDGDGTDIAAALMTAVRTPDLSDVVLVSDGRWNLGEDPAAVARTFETPVHTITVGNRSEVFDAVIAGVSASPVGRDGTSLPVEVTVATSIPSETPITVTIARDGAAVASGQLLPSGATSARLRLEVPLTGVGAHRFTATIDPPGDGNDANNTRQFTVTARKNRFALLIAAAEPSPDLAFLRRVIERDSSFTLDVAVGRGARGDILQALPDDLGRYDGIVLIDGGGSLLTGEAAARLRDHAGGGSGLWVLGSTPPGPSGAALEQTLPLRFAGSPVRTDTTFTVTPTDAGRSHFVTAESADAGGVWSTLPPLPPVTPTDTTGRDGIVLATAAPLGNTTVRMPAIAAGAIGSGKVLVMPLSGIWRWSLVMTGAGRDGGFYERFVTGALNWLTVETDTAPLTVTTGSQSYLSGQSVRFEARLFDNVYTPVSGAEITLDIDGDAATRTILDETAPAVYTADVTGIGPGAHTFCAAAYRDRAEFATATGSFTVQDFSLEMLASAADPVLMRSLAALTGGIAVSPAGIDSVIAAISPGATLERQTSEHHPALNPFVPFSALVLLAVEWTVRKRRGML